MCLPTIISASLYKTVRIFSFEVFLLIACYAHYNLRKCLTMKLYFYASKIFWVDYEGLFLISIACGETCSRYIIVHRWNPKEEMIVLLYLVNEFDLFETFMIKVWTWKSEKAIFKLPNLSPWMSKDWTMYCGKKDK